MIRRLLPLCFALASASAVVSASAVAQGRVLPDGVPEVRYLPDPLYSQEGFRFGTILNFQKVIFWHYEGSLMLGSGTSPTTLMDNNCVEQQTAAASEIRDSAKRELVMKEIDQDCAIDENPWKFSVVDPNLYTQYQAGSGIPVVVYYTRPIWAPFGVLETLAVRALWTYTLNYVQKIFPIDPDLPAFKFFSLDKGEMPVATAVNPAEGYTKGRVVKASMDHLIRKTYEITFQQGAHGTNFTRLSVNSSEMFDHLVLSMLTGKQVRIGYLRMFSWEGFWVSAVRGYKTYYRVTSVEILPDEPVPDGGPQ